MNKLIFYNLKTNEEKTVEVLKENQLDLILKMKNDNWLLKECIGECSICNKKLFETEKLHCEKFVHED